MAPVLALYEDVLADGAALALPAAARMIFLVHGGATIAGRALRDGEAWHGEGAATVHAGSAGATCWRFELAAPPATTNAPVNSSAATCLLMRSSLVLRFTARPPALMAGSAEFFTTLVLIRSVYTVLVRSASYTPHRRRSSDRISHYGPARRIAATQQSDDNQGSSGQAGRGEVGRDLGSSR